MRIHLSLGSRAATLPAERTVVVAPPAASWPFVYPLAVNWPAGPTALSMPAIHEAFVNHQTAGTRLVTTQALFLFQTWSDAIGDRDVVIVATADRDSLATHAPEILARRGLFSDVVVEDGTTPESGGSVAGAGGAVAQLAAAFRLDDPLERLRLCVSALAEGRTPATLLAAASTCMEVNDLDAAARDLDEAIALAPQWAAAHFERGKLALRADDMEAASGSFRQAAILMPRFGSAWANLGATLGELDQADAALDAFVHALQCDPVSHQTLNNIGVVSRELGKLGESEAAFRQVIQLAPDMAFGYYNLGHTLFLQGRYQAALGAYAEGQRRDPERNPVQATRLAMCRLAAGDAAGALDDLQRATGGLPREYRQQLLADTRTIALALLTHRPDLPGWHQVNEWLASQLRA
jgi:tetratricopeptide (TPR) repeat protein